MDTEISIGQAIKVFLQKSKIKTDMQALQITKIWEELMGKTIAKYTDKIEIYRNSLIIHTQIATLKQELNFQKETIINRVNDVLQEKLIKEIVIK
jgi:hypothetical protein